MNKPSDPRGELALIARIRDDSEHRPRGSVRLGIGDDCAILRAPAGHEILVTTDFCLEGLHFRRDWHSAESVGHRCLGRGLSDLAAMGAKPVAAFLSLALPSNIDPRWTNGFFAGLRALADRFHVPLAGGDTAASPSKHILADIMLVGSAPAGEALRRSAARSGDLLYVTGALGGAAAQLLSMKSGSGSVRRYGPQTFPEPRLQAGAALLRRRLATACIDISDGLSTDLKHLCDESGLAVELELDRIPIHALAEGRLDLALYGGEDYELLFAARPDTRMPRTVAGTPVTRIGHFLRNKGRPPMAAIDSTGVRTALEAGGWEHSIG